MFTFIALAACLSQDPIFDRWRAWSSFETGDYVVVEYTGGGGRDKRTLRSKERDSLGIGSSLADERGFGGNAEVIRRDGRCFCNTVHVWSTKSVGKLDVVEIKGRKFECVVLEIETPKQGCTPFAWRKTIWYCPAIPGHVAREKSVTPGGESEFVVAEVGTGGTATEKGGEEDFQYTEWDAWKDFDKGASVTFHMKPGGDMEMWMTTTMLEKTGTAITLATRTKTRMKMGDDSQENEVDGGTRKVEKAGGARFDPNQECPMCKKRFKDHQKPKIVRKEGEVAGKKASLIEVTYVNCRDDKPIASMVYCKDVPGWMVEMGQMKVSAFEKK
ncbi:MAG: hypothetical protein HYY17_01680 [Planctomycetes bacterium]|nr:hypothetical protein [Planctomycetota bacterium]